MDTGRSRLTQASAVDLSSQLSFCWNRLGPRPFDFEVGLQTNEISRAVASGGLDRVRPFHRIDYKLPHPYHMGRCFVCLGLMAYPCASNHRPRWLGLLRRLRRKVRQRASDQDGRLQKQDRRCKLFRDDHSRDDPLVYPILSATLL